MLLTATTKEGVVHLHGGGFKEGFIPVFTSGIHVTSIRNEKPSAIIIADGYVSTKINWAWCVSYGKFLLGHNLNYTSTYIGVSDRTRENAQADPCYLGIEVKNNTKYSIGGMVPIEYKLTCMQGEFISIPIPDSMGYIVSVPANMLGLRVSKTNTAISGIVEFHGTKMFTIGTSNGSLINIIINSNLIKRIY